MSIKSKIYLDEVVENTERKFGSALSYQHFYVVYPDGTEVPAMVTLNTIKDAEETAVKNPEDVERAHNGFFDSLFLGD